MLVGVGEWLEGVTTRTRKCSVWTSQCHLSRHCFDYTWPEFFGPCPKLSTLEWRTPIIAQEETDTTGCFEQLVPVGALQTRKQIGNDLMKTM